MRAAHPRDLLAIASAVLLLASAVTAAGSLRDWVRTRSTPAVAAVPARTAEEVALSTHKRTRTTPEAAAPAERVPPKSVRKTSAQKPGSTTPVPGAREASPGASVPDRSSLP
jgi:hypothetical protein